MAFPATPTPGQQVEEPAGSGNWFEWTPNHLAPGIGAWVPIPGPAAGAGDGRFENAYGPADVWTVGHNLNQRLVSVQVVDTAGTVCIPSVDYTNANVVTLTFSEPVTGTVVVRR